MDAFILASFGPALNAFTSNLLEKIAAEYNLPLEELKTKFGGVAPEPQVAPKVVPKPSKANEKTQCVGLTAKGGQCRNKCIENCNKCRMHENQAMLPAKEAPEKKARSKKPKQVKVIPEHDHPVGVFSQTCGLCQTHGDVLDPGLPDRKFEKIEGGASVTERLASMIASFENEDE